jgi:hypothetical protein
MVWGFRGQHLQIINGVSAGLPLRKIRPPDWKEARLIRIGNNQWFFYMQQISP